MKYLVLSLLAFSAIGPANAASRGHFLTAERLLEKCAASSDDADPNGKSTACLSYITGVADGLDAARLALDRDDCVPIDATSGSLRDTVISWMVRNPEYGKMNAALVVITAIGERFPKCSAQ
jgi:hypothetical protein